MFKTPMKMHFARQIILFKKTLEYQNPISIYQTITSFTFVFKVPIGQTWAIVQTITNTLFVIVKQCVLNQTQGY